MMPEERTHWKKLTDPNYIGSWDFDQGEKRTLTIAKTAQEMVIDMESGGREKKPCTVAHFKEKSKPIILNKTNCKTIEGLYGTPYIEDWVGKKITLYVEKVKAFGKLTDALRILNEIPKAQTCSDCGSEIKSANGYSAENVAAMTKKKYGVSLCSACSKERKNAANQ